LNIRSISIIATLLISALITAEAQAAKFYRFQDAEGKLVVSSTLPPEVSQKGYEIVNEMGVIISTVAPRKTEQQLLEDLANKVRLEAEKKRFEEQEQLDSILINSYSDISDIERARDNEITAKERDRMLLKQNIRRLTRLLEDTQTRAARDERLGIDVSERILKEVAGFKRRIGLENEEVIKVEDDKERIIERYASSIIRFSELKAAEQLRRHQPEKLTKESGTVIYQCLSVEKCDASWQLALRYASDYSTTELAWANETTIMMRKPKRKDDVSLLLTRVNSRSGKRASLVLEVRCHKSLTGEALCKSESVVSIRKGFAPYLID